MGLLTSNNTGKGSFLDSVIQFVVKRNNAVCLLSYIAGIVVFLSLAHESVNAGTYISENALLPGLVHGQFRDDSLARGYLTDLEEEAKRYPNGVPHAWLAAQFRQLGLDVGTQDFTLEYNLGVGMNYTGRNVYGILRARRHSSRESVVLTTPYRPPNSVFTPTNGGIALMMALAKSFRGATHWAKDIIFLVTEHEQLGIQAWLEAYHRVSPVSGMLHGHHLTERAGSIQAAINLEIPDSRASYVDVKVEGLNGQLPNLDLANLVHRLCHRERVPSTFKQRMDPFNPASFEGYLENLVTMLSMMSTQSTGIPNGNHGLFHRFGIEAITLASFYEPGAYPVRFYELGRIVEGIFRSLNNLQERFHQSFFFYLLAGTSRYVSIGVYMIPFALIAAPILLKGVSIWFGIGKASKEKTDHPPKSPNYDGVLAAILCCHAVGFALLFAPSYAANFGVKYYGLETDETIYFGYAGVSVVLATLLLFINTSGNTALIRCIGHVEMASLLFAVSMQNISLAAFAAVITTPLYLLSGKSASKTGAFTRRLAVLAAHPLVILQLALLFDTYRTFPEETVMTILVKSLAAAKRSLMYSVVDSYIYGNWLFTVAVAVYTPIWMIHWIVTGK